MPQVQRGVSQSSDYATSLDNSMNVAFSKQTPAGGRQPKINLDNMRLHTALDFKPGYHGSDQKSSTANSTQNRGASKIRYASNNFKLVLPNQEQMFESIARPNIGPPSN